MDIDNIFIKMQQAYYNSPACIRKGFKYRMSNFTYKLLINAYVNQGGDKKHIITEFLGVKIELDDMMPDYIFHLYEKNQIEFQN